MITKTVFAQSGRRWALLAPISLKIPLASVLAIAFSYVNDLPHPEATSREVWRVYSRASLRAVVVRF